MRQFKSLALSDLARRQTRITKCGAVLWSSSARIAADRMQFLSFDGDDQKWQGHVLHQESANTAMF